MGPRPPADRLEAWILEAKAHGVDRIICFMPEPELIEKGIAREADFSIQQGLVFSHFPIQDFGIPKSPEDEARYRALMLDVNRALQSGQTVMVHCAGGIGRAGTACCCLLVQQGMAATDAIKAVSQARGHSVPETEGQLQFIASFMQSLAFKN